MKNILPILLTALLLASCGKLSENNSVSTEAMTAAYSPETSVQGRGYDQTAKVKFEESADKNAETASLQPKIIKTANISYRVKDLNQSHAQILEMLKQHRAYCTSDNKNNDSYRLNANLEIRVPAESFDALCEQLMSESIYTDYKNISQQDVTEEYVDVAARLKSKKAVEQQYMELLKKATKVSDILEIENSLRVIREEIEATEARLRVLDNRVALSTINLNIYQQLDYIPQPSLGFVSQVKESVVRGWQNLVELLIWLVRQWPFLLAGAAIGLFVFRRRK